MTSKIDAPQIGLLDVDVEVVRAEGRPLESLLAQLGVELEHVEEDIDLPLTGWRVLGRQVAGDVTIGAPANPTRSIWRIAHVSADRDGRLVSPGRVSPESLPLRRSRVERAKGLILRWAPISEDEAKDGVFVIDVVNTGAVRWRPDGDSLFVVGTLARPGVAPIATGFGFFGGQQPGVPLDPGEYVRLQVSVNDAQWTSMEPGRYELHAMLAALPVKAPEPLSLSVTQQQIDQRVSRLRSPVPSRVDKKRSLRASHAHQTMLLGAAEHLEEIARAVVSSGNTQDAVAAVARVLRIDREAAAVIVHGPMTQFTTESVRQMRDLVLQIENELASPS